MLTQRIEPVVVRLVGPRRAHARRNGQTGARVEVLVQLADALAETGGRVHRALAQLAQA